VTQRLKLEPSPISQTRVAKVFSPTCECESQAATIDFDLRKSDHLRVGIRINGREMTISNGDFRRGLVHVRWNGRDAAGNIVPDGVYYAVVHMLREERTIDLPNPIRVDTQRPSITLLGMRTVGRRTTFSYRVSEPAHALLFVNGRREVRTYSTRRVGSFHWYGLMQGAVNPPRLVLEAEDLAGNRSAPERVKAA
jgi:hypothetical protein